jgi:hypothetical protein
VKDHFPGGSAGSALEFIGNSVGSAESAASGVPAKHGITPGGVLGELKGVKEFIENKIEVLAAMADMNLIRLIPGCSGCSGFFTVKFPSPGITFCLRGK